MRATIMYAAGDVRVEDVADPALVDPTDAIVRVTSGCICGSDLWPYADMAPSETGQSMGHEAIGVVGDGGGGGELGATDVVAERGEAAVQRVRDLTGGFRVHAVLECVGTEASTRTSVEIARPGGAVGRVSVP